MTAPEAQADQPSPPIEEPAFRRLGHVPALDGLRGAALVMVLVTHSPILFNVFEDRIFHNGFLDGFVTGGYAGLDIFFALSGFLITALILRERNSTGHVSLRAFYRRRALRLLPALVFFLSCHMIYTIIRHLSVARERSTDVAALFYFLNYKVTVNQASVPGDLRHLWSLSVEEQFYFVWPAALVLLLGVPRLRRYLVPIIVSAIALITLRRAELWHLSHDWSHVAWRADARVDEMLIGGLLAWLWTRNRTPKRHVALYGWIAVIAFFVSMHQSLVDHAWPYLGGYTLYAITTAFVILAILDSTWVLNRGLGSRPMVALGRASYSIYLWHLPIFIYVVDLGKTWGAPARVVVAYGLTGICAGFSYWFIERPAINYKVRIEARRSATRDSGLADRPVRLDEHR
ncbi:MAG TPA: acyltransferase [Acidimicrobiia bacterium]|jgi:peptidoglycan/LPS O-acetylase OafA/YrhL